MPSHCRIQEASVLNILPCQLCSTMVAGMEIRMLRPQCKDSQRLVDWIEHGKPRAIGNPNPSSPLCPLPGWLLQELLKPNAGVHDAIKHMYLKTLFFGVSANPEGTQLLEVIPPHLTSSLLACLWRRRQAHSLNRPWLLAGVHFLVPL